MPRISNMTEIGGTGLNQWGGYLQDEFLRQLQGARGKRVFREMSENDDIVGACLYAIEYLARQVDWTVEEADPEKGTGEKDEKSADVEWLEGALFEDMSQPWGDTISEILTMLPYGFSAFEIVYKRRVGPEETDPTRRSQFNDGAIGWRKWAFRGQETIERWDFDDAGGVAGFWQRLPDSTEIYIPIEKALLFRTTTKRGNPEGRSILRNAYESWYYKKRIRVIEGIGVERDLNGLPILKAPEGVDIWNQNDAAAYEAGQRALKIVTNVRMDEQMGMVLPFEWQFELAGTGGGKGAKMDTGAIITRYDTRIAMTMLADFILIAHDKVGTQAVAETKMRAFALALTAFLDHVRDVVNRVAIPRLWRLNGRPLNNMPKITHGEVDPVDLAALGEYLKALSVAGAPLFPNVALEKFVHDAAGMPAPPEGFEERQATLQQQEEQQRSDELDIERVKATRGARPGDDPGASKVT